MIDCRIRGSARNVRSGSSWKVINARLAEISSASELTDSDLPWILSESTESDGRGVGCSDITEREECVTGSASESPASDEKRSDSVSICDEYSRSVTGGV
jgi:hypothetical protein